MEAKAKATKSRYFTSLDYYSKRDAKMNFYGALLTAGWKIYGYHEDKSDSMTDYYSPARWDGVAVKDGYVLCIDVYSASDSGKPITRSIEEWVQCTACNGVGSDAQGWTLAEARQRPQAYHLHRLLKQYPGSMPISDIEIVTASRHRMSVGSQVVSQIYFHTNGYEKCPTCRGRGETLASSKSVQVDTWPTFQVNPKRNAWHLEKGGVIISSGMSIAKLYDGYYEGNHEEKEEAVKAAATELVAMLESSMTDGTKPKPAIPAAVDGGIEILNYSPKSFAVRGNTKPYKDELGREGLGGIFNGRLTAPDTGEKFAGWIFPTDRLPGVLSFLERIKGQ